MKDYSSPDDEARGGVDPRYRISIFPSISKGDNHVSDDRVLGVVVVILAIEQRERPNSYG
jgi:hypothetical protein